VRGKRDTQLKYLHQNGPTLANCHHLMNVAVKLKQRTLACHEYKLTCKHERIKQALFTHHYGAECDQLS